MRKHKGNNGLTVTVRNNDMEAAMRQLKRKLQRCNMFKELKQKRFYEKPCNKRRRKQRESLKRIRMANARRNRWRRR